MSGEQRAGQDLRLFFAVQLTKSLREVAAGLQQELADAAGDVRMNWVAPQNLHLTLKFIGDAPAQKLSDFVAVGERVARGGAPFNIQFEGVGCFTSRGCPRTIWMGLAQEVPELTALARELDRALVEMQLAEPERRPFTAHLTLGRVRSQRRCGRLMEEVRGLAEAPVGVQRVRSFTLVSSELTGTGPIYTKQASFELSR